MKKFAEKSLLWVRIWWWLINSALVWWEWNIFILNFDVFLSELIFLVLNISLLTQQSLHDLRGSLKTFGIAVCVAPRNVWITCLAQRNPRPPLLQWSLLPGYVRAAVLSVSHPQIAQFTAAEAQKRQRQLLSSYQTRPGDPGFRAEQESWTTSAEMQTKNWLTKQAQNQLARSTNQPTTRKYQPGRVKRVISSQSPKNMFISLFWVLSLCFQKIINDTVDGRNPAPPGMYEAL